MKNAGLPLRMTFLTEEITYAGQNVPIGADLIFAAADFPALKIGVANLRRPLGTIPPSSY